MMDKSMKLNIVWQTTGYEIIKGLQKNRQIKHHTTNIMKIKTWLKPMQPHEKYTKKRNCNTGVYKKYNQRNKETKGSHIFVEEDLVKK